VSIAHWSRRKCDGLLGGGGRGNGVPDNGERRKNTTTANRGEG
jgi:hypothetical protein